ncbi:hypothetical protein GCM10007895_06050 [Paraferrimonas sedimenticola]|uniref:Lysozyme n=2 Tax=Paraferrimonas sedimenticola TaxID=375674 RepID=A0AA37RU82_9GAMM|nr:hypothetical protein GCM10007895_06050 [Paraferrimonas sedimenticola]
MLTTYVDPAGIMTACYGHTSPKLKEGQVFTEAECLEKLAKDLSRHNDALLKLTAPLHLTRGEHIAYLSFIYNVGPGAFERSTLRAYLMQGHRLKACNELRRWVWANGVKLPGLVSRREQERRYCLRGVLSNA